MNITNVPPELLHPSLRNGEEVQRPPNNHESGYALCHRCGVNPDSLKFQNRAICETCIAIMQAHKL